MLVYGECLSLAMTGNNSDDFTNCLHIWWFEHILANEKSAILSGDSLAVSFLLGFKATAEQSETNFSNVCITKYAKWETRFMPRAIRTQNPDNKTPGFLFLTWEI